MSGRWGRVWEDCQGGMWRVKGVGEGGRERRWKSERACHTTIRTYITLPRSATSKYILLHQVYQPILFQQIHHSTNMCYSTNIYYSANVFFSTNIYYFATYATLHDSTIQCILFLWFKHVLAQARVVPASRFCFCIRIHFGSP